MRRLRRKRGCRSLLQGRAAEDTGVTSVFAVGPRIIASHDQISGATGFRRRISLVLMRH